MGPNIVSAPPPTKTKSTVPHTRGGRVASAVKSVRVRRCRVGVRILFCSSASRAAPLPTAPWAQRRRR